MGSSHTLQPMRRGAVRCGFQIQTRQFPFLDEASMGAGVDGCKARMQGTGRDIPCH